MHRLLLLFAHPLFRALNCLYLELTMELVSSKITGFSQQDHTENHTSQTQRSITAVAQTPTQHTGCGAIGAFNDFIFRLSWCLR